SAARTPGAGRPGPCGTPPCRDGRPRGRHRPRGSAARDPLPSRQRCRAGPESGPSKSLLRIAAHTCTVTPRTGTGSARLAPRRESFPQAGQIIPSLQSLTAVRQLQRDFPGLDLEVAANPSQHGTNAKVSNLINMMPHVRHDYLVIADSDVRVPCDYLERVIAPLADEGVGIVTCPYRGAP